MPTQRSISADFHFDHVQISAPVNAVASRWDKTLARSRDCVARPVRRIQEVHA